MPVLKVFYDLYNRVLATFGSMDEIVNRVASSGLVTIDLDELRGTDDIISLDIAPQLFQGLILREKDFREYVKGNNWSQYRDKVVALHCTADAIVPVWAYMLIAVALKPFAKDVFFGTQAEAEELVFCKRIAELDIAPYKGAKVVIKGCGDRPVPHNAFVMLTARLQPQVASIMYGEPCSTVPIYKSKIKA